MARRRTVRTDRMHCCVTSLKGPAVVVSGAHLCVVIISTTIVNFPGTCCLTNRINKFVYNNNGLGAYSFEFKTEDGTYRKEDGGIVTRTEGSSMVVRGEYGYVDPEGRYYTLKYIADANGFQPQLEEDTRFNDRRIV
ncbi:larval cuticle protein 16/17-like isoform X2 [Hyposmocoma kahamanoa]|uniref:larval cuticle protein 16/17-like isoform X2 n=1 Tax=Hyposmocoma kahamanoa TaxID=1477025 RepID=UPI000E6D5CC9|nr:larval cuticle protein 16/17-like isoform X2 [Hyposmocoma kahamanoa]